MRGLAPLWDGTGRNRSCPLPSPACRPAAQRPQMGPVAWALSNPVLSHGQQARGQPGQRTTQAFQAAAAAATTDSSTPTGDALAAATGCVQPVVAWQVLGGPGRKQVGKEQGPRVGGQGLGLGRAALRSVAIVGCLSPRKPPSPAPASARAQRPLEQTFPSPQITGPHPCPCPPLNGVECLLCASHSVHLHLFKPYSAVRWVLLPPFSR